MNKFMKDLRTLRGPASFIYIGSVWAMWLGIFQMSEASTGGRSIPWSIGVNWLGIGVAFVCTAVVVSRLEQELKELKGELKSLRDQKNG